MKTRSFHHALSMAVACLLLGACAGNPGSTDPADAGGGTGGTGGSGGAGGTGADVSLTIEVRRGPLTPVEQIGSDNTAPVEDAVVVVRDAGGKEVGRLMSDANGIAQLALPAGNYVVGVETCPGATAPALPQTVELTDGSPATARLECDTGIR